MQVRMRAGLLLVFTLLGCELGGPTQSAEPTPTPGPTFAPGTRWEVVASPPYMQMEALDFVNAQDGWAVGDPNAVLRTSDGGVNWAAPLALPSTRIPTLSHYESVSFVDPRLGFIGGSYGVFKTTDAGASWTPVPPFEHENGPPPVDQRAYVKFRDYEHGVVVWRGDVYRTTDGGATWKPAPLGGGAFRRLGQVGSELAVLTDLRLWVSKPDATWGEMLLPEVGPRQGFSDFWFLDDQNGWVTGKAIYRTTDGGAKWTPLTGVGGAKSIRFLDAARGWLVDGRTWKATRTGGATWVDVPYQAYGGDSRNVPWGIEVADPGNVFVFTGTGVIRRWVAP